MTAIAIARPIPGIAPNTATPTRHTMDSQNSQRWMRKIRIRSTTSNRPMAEAITTAARRRGGQMLEQVRGRHQQQGNAIAPTTPVNWVLAPAASATGVRDELLLMGKPWKNPAARLAAPSPTISWLGSTFAPVRAA